MALRITFSGPGSLSIRIGKSSWLDVASASPEVRLLVGDASDALSAYASAPRDRDGRGRDGRSDRTGEAPAAGSVTAEMEAAAVSAFLADADVARLGRSLAGVYAAMESVRRAQIADDDAEGN